MRTVHIDIETRHPTDLIKHGTHRSSEDASILMVAWAVDDGPINIDDSGALPPALADLLRDPAVLKVAHNASFERTMLRACWGVECPPEQWACTQVLAYANGLPGSLGECAFVLGLAEQKDPIGKKLIKMFSLPQKPTKKQPKVWLNREDRPAEWEQFKTYCVKDVEVERAIHHRLRDIPRKEWRLWSIDQRANDSGLRVDMRLIEAAIRIDDATTKALLDEAVAITGLDNPNSVAQIKAWLLEAHGETVESLNKESVAGLTKSLNGSAKRVLEIRQQLGKTSIDKYRAMARSVCADGRIRGLLQFYGASRTGRWAGRLVQVQNFPRSVIEEFEDLDAAREATMLGDSALLSAIYGNPSQILADLLRTAMVAEDGSRLIVCDESAIEARVLAWLADEKWRLDVFNTHGKIYEASASQMFKVPLERIKKGNPEYALRQKGKVAELALGYQGGPGALITMGALKMGLSEDELQPLVNAWRGANKGVVALWSQMESDVKRCIRDRVHVTRDKYGLSMDGKTLLIHLPSGRALSYWNTRIESSQIRFDGMDQVKKKWLTIDTYGGKIVENLTQAIARDCMAEAMILADDAGYDIRMTVHDELVIEAPIGFGSIEEVEALMGRPIKWAEGLPLKGAGFESTYYMKG